MSILALRSWWISLDLRGGRVARGRFCDGMRIFFSVGEPSGDLHGANLIARAAARQPTLECVGYGGPKMAAAGCRLHADLTQLAVMWLLRAVLNLPRFWQLVCRADRYFRHQRPDAVVLIDYPGFNWWIARRAKVHKIPVFYYGAPQMWAWAPWRVHKMRRLVNHVLCKLPFEAELVPAARLSGDLCRPSLFRRAGRPAAGRTIPAAMCSSRDDRWSRSCPVPAPRRSRRTWQAFCKTARRIHCRCPEVHFAIAAFNSHQAELAGRISAQESLPLQVYVGKTPELIRLAEACLACSGSVSLELLYHLKPTIIHYKVSRLAFFVQRYFRTVRFITLVNLLASDQPVLSGRRIVRCADRPRALSGIS